MNLSDELKELQRLHESGFLSDEELAQAKVKVLTSDSSQHIPPVVPELAPTPVAVIAGLPTQQQIEEVRLQHELLQLDRDWNEGRKAYMVMGKYGHLYVPHKLSSFVGVCLCGVLGLFIMGAAIPAGGGLMGVLIGILCMFGGGGYCFYTYNKAAAYEEEESYYQQRRAQLVKAIYDLRNAN